MAKFAPDAGLDAALNYFTDADKLVACSAQPTTYAEANATFALADVAVTGADFTQADGTTSGRKETVAAKTGVTVDTTGTVTHLALIKTGDTTLRYVTTTTSQAVSSGGTADFGAWDIEIGDPS